MLPSCEGPIGSFIYGETNDIQMSLYFCTIWLFYICEIGLFKVWHILKCRTRDAVKEVVLHRYLSCIAFGLMLKETATSQIKCLHYDLAARIDRYARDLLNEACVSSLNCQNLNLNLNQKMQDSFAC